MNCASCPFCGAPIPADNRDRPNLGCWRCGESVELTPNAAKRIVQRWLDSEALPYTKLAAKTVSFADLARDSCIFVKVHGWKPNPAWVVLDQVAKRNGFRVEAVGFSV